MQKIYFGAPGTGKSHKIKHKDLNGISDAKVFRTTFHPDYDYSQFLGCYKPVSLEIDNGNLTVEELKKKLQELKKQKQTRPEQILGTLYWKSLDRCKSQLQLVIGKDNRMGGEIDKGIAIGKYLEKECSLGSISYKYVPQIFIEAYFAAWVAFLQNLNQSECQKVEDVFLVIEEINRGNCAQIFGDIFQLLDRDATGLSSYAVNAGNDLGEYLQFRFRKEKLWDEYRQFIIGLTQIQDPSYEWDDQTLKLLLPPNFSILATMNTSDQSLFPMDSAFKRRFDWEYVPIRYKKDEVPLEEREKWNADEVEIELYPRDYKAENDEVLFENPKWTKFLKKINQDIRAKTFSEDKQMGEFFVKGMKNGDKTVIDFKTFRSKVLFYLWDSVYKDCIDSKCFFNPEDDEAKVIYFQDLFKNDDEAARTIIRMIQYLDKDKDGNELNEILIKR